MTLDVVYYRTAAYTLCIMHSGYHSLLISANNA